MSPSKTRYENIFFAVEGGFAEIRLVKLSRFAEAHPAITEIDLNPVIVRSDGYTIVDARMIVGELFHRISKGSGP